LRLTFDVRDRVPDGFSPEGEVPDSGLLVGYVGCPGAVKIVEYIDREALSREHGCGVGHGGVAAGRSVQADDGREALAVGGLRDESIVGDRLAAGVEGGTGLGDGMHGFWHSFEFQVSSFG
jgi:hypothetical protein